MFAKTANKSERFSGKRSAFLISNQEGIVQNIQILFDNRREICF